jgi:hypothetical protein
MRKALARISFPIINAPQFRSPSAQPVRPQRHIHAHHKRCPQVSARTANGQVFSYEIFNRHQSKKQEKVFLHGKWQHGSANED